MKTLFQHYLYSLCTAAALFATPLIGHALPITYDIGAGSAPGFSASWLHAGTNQMGSTGYYANGTKTSMTGSLILDMTALTASGSISGTGDFGMGNDSWSLTFTGASAGTVSFVDGDTDLLSLSYLLSDSSGLVDSGTFYFADRDFNGGTISDGPNYIDDSVLYLWGNNWINVNGGSTDRTAFMNAGGTPLGLDLYGEARTVPEPGIVALLALGLAGFGIARRRSNT